MAEATGRGAAGGRGWDAAYAGEPPAWDIGRAQPVVEAIAAAGGFRGRVLDAGCGTGENALYLASLGLAVIGADWSQRAIDLARAKAAGRGSLAEFVVADATRLPAELSGTFASALDSGLFHTFDDATRSAYVESLGGVIAGGGTFHLLCFSDHEPGSWGPRRITRAEIHSAFAVGWSVRAVEPIQFAVRHSPDGARGWHATIDRLGTDD